MGTPAGATRTRHGLRPARREAQTDISSHRMADKMRLFDTNGAHPFREPRGGLAEFEPLPKVTHRPEVGQVDEVDAVSFGDSPHVAGPPPGRSREPVHEYNGGAFPGRLEAYRPASYPYFAPRIRNPYRLTSSIRVARHRYLP